MMICTLLLAGSLLSAVDSPPRVIVVVGAEGTPEFGAQFRNWADRWQTAVQQAGADCRVIGLTEITPETPDNFELKTELERLTENTSSTAATLWLVLIGHGTFDGKTARFNLRGPDLSATELASWLKPLKQPIAVVNCSSASGPFLNTLSAPGRVIITATRAGSETNFARFGDGFSAALNDLASDLDKDEQVSLLEAFLAAAARVREFYADSGRLATEHPLLDDNGDRLGTPADWFEGVVAVKSARNGARPDGLQANHWTLIRSVAERALPTDVRIHRDELERQLAELRQRKPNLTEDEYLDLIEPVLLELSRIGEEHSREMPPSQ